MPLPVLRMKRDIGQHINGRFKHIQASVCADMMEAVSRVAALHIQTEGFSVAVGAALMGVARNTLRIRADKHGVVILGIFIQESDLGEVRHHISYDAAMLDEIRKCSYTVKKQQHKLRTAYPTILYQSGAVTRKCCCSIFMPLK
jgi:hypothetical protein